MKKLFFSIVVLFFTVISNAQEKPVAMENTHRDVIAYGIPLPDEGVIADKYADDYSHCAIDQTKKDVLLPVTGKDGKYTAEFIYNKSDNSWSFIKKLNGAPGDYIFELVQNKPTPVLKNKNVTVKN